MVNKQFIAQNRPAEKPAADMSVSLSGLRLDNPVVPASGTFGYGNEFRDFYDINILGSFSFKGTTRDARFGNPTPRIAECTAGMINAVGLQNPGIDAVIAEELPRLKTFFHLLFLHGCLCLYFFLRQTGYFYHSRCCFHLPFTILLGKCCLLRFQLD